MSTTTTTSRKKVKAIGYKVVYFDPNTGKLWSGSKVWNKNALEYEVNVVTKPIRGTKLFAFTSIMDATFYVSNILTTRHIKIFKCEIVNPIKDGWFTALISLDLVRKPFSQNITNPDYSLSSCVVCDSIELLEEVII